MKNKLVRGFLKIIDYHRSGINGVASFSQSGEDIIVSRILNRLCIDKPQYLDLGACHPVKLSNTYLLYKNNAQGVLVEANPVLCNELRQARKQDTILNIGVGQHNSESMDFYVLDNEYLSTFSQQEVNKIQQFGKNKLIDTIKVPVLTVNQIIQEYFETRPNFISLDIEGMDYEILTNLDLSRFAPEVFCIETITYTQNNTETKRTDIIDYMLKNGYMIYADTYINTIFVLEESWKKR